MNEARGAEALASVKAMLESARDFDESQETLEIGAQIKLER